MIESSVNSKILHDNDSWPNYGTTPIAITDSSLIETGDHSDRETKGSNWTAYVNVVCLIAGSGTLGIPYAIQQGGWISLGVLFLSGVICTYANIKLIECLYHDGKTRKTSISDLAYDAFGNIGLRIVGFFFTAISIGCSILYLVLAGESLQPLFVNIGIDLGMTNWIYICSATMAVPFLFLKTMKEAAWLSVFGALTTALAVFVVFVKSIMEYSPSAPTQHDFVNFRDIPLAMATFSFSYAGNIVFPHVEASMKHPRSWPTIYIYAMCTVTLMYLLIGIPAYITYGHTTLSPIYLNLPPGFAVTTSILMMTAHVLLALPIYQTAFCLEIEDYMGISVENLGKIREFIYRFLCRLFIVVITTYSAVTIPYFSDLMALLGASGNGLLLSIMPILFWVKLFGWNQLNGWKEKCWVIFALIFSFYGFFIGTFDALAALWLDILGESETGQ
ncbi:3661_t:CDS:2 [Dentiscutata erythropus]|uniref:3661_t:CDS:1 n=1 Tax=Dentiscutata erythropus TaxID=1348616 RepID=A0A9N8WNM8_9GLOM|nr:3661_t:CDS:2 [Dentiscutata erythropus]